MEIDKVFRGLAADGHDALDIGGLFNDGGGPLQVFGADKADFGFAVA